MEELETVKNKISLIDYIQGNGGKIKNLGGGTFSVEPCPVCGHKDHFRVNSNSNYYNSFNGCCKGGDILNYMQEVEHLTFKEAKEKLYKITNTSIQEYKPNIVKENTQTKEQWEEAERQEYIKKQNAKFIKEALEKQTGENKQKVYEYMQTRGISKEIADKYHLFISNKVYVDKDHLERLVIPIYENGQPISYVARAIKKDVQGRAKALNSAGTQTPLNIDYIKNNEESNDNLIYVCEAWADALSLEDIGKKAIAIHSTNQANRFIDIVKENIQTASKYKYILCCDDDEAGKKANTKLAEELTKLEIKSTYVEIPKGYKDINEWYSNTQKEVFIEELKQNTYNKYENRTVDYYIGNSYLDEIKSWSKYPSKKTNFPCLDECLNGGIRPWLYVIGAIPSLGKTTFTLQLADNIAKQGNKVIIFSLEQSKFELVSKAISRITWENSPGNARTHTFIMGNSNIDSITLNAMEQYSNKIAPNEIIEESIFNLNVDTIRDYIKDYIAETNERPTIIIDYLQALAPSNTKLTDKQQIDHNIITLKQISTKYKVPIIVISSFNRQNYSQTASYEAYKESGGIEYTADVLITMQLKLLSDKENPTREEIREAKKAIPRQVQLVCLKNRSGKSSFCIEYEFNPVFNAFKEIPKEYQDEM